MQKNYQQYDGPEDMLEVDLVCSLTASNGSTHILIACDVFLRYLFAVALRPDTDSIAEVLLSIFKETRT